MGLCRCLLVNTLVIVKRVCVCVRAHADALIRVDAQAEKIH